MNERIKELAEQAGFTTDEANMTVGNYKDGNEYFYAEDFIEDELKKFAELIVRECCNVLQNEDILHSGYGYNQGFLHKKIKEHFGVKE